ncbi:hypothetical protein [Rubritalea marina]|uniref:hypothetical protein n=1 Tax=Rubritalea marina TaxID=361055 RepID=UPI0003AA61F8|nr:hypothetical protein [Rubritalea marina]
MPDHDVVEHFDFIGDFEVVRLLKITPTESIESTPTGLTFKVFSNNQELKIYHSAIDDAYQLFTIYRDDGVSDLDSFGNLSIQPGLQARMITAQTTKQIALSNASLIITEFPPLSNTVLVTVAEKIEKGE